MEETIQTALWNVFVFLPDPVNLISERATQKGFAAK